MAILYNPGMLIIGVGIDSMLKLIALVGLFFIVGCSMFYYGHTKEEWMSFSEEEKLSSSQEYKKIMEAKREQQAENTIDDRSGSVADFGIKKSKP